MIFNGIMGFVMKMKLNPIKAIRQKCLDCSTYQVKEIRNCVIVDCPLYPYRMGKRPTTKVST